MMITKRDNSMVEFKKEKIYNAIFKAMKYGSGIIDEGIANKIANDIKKDVAHKDIVTILDIETMVYDKLIENKQSMTAKSYEGYRSVQEYKRINHPLDDSILGLVNHTNIEVMTENSNKQASLASTQRDLIAGEVSKYISKKELIPPRIIQAMQEGVLKMHDLDYFLQDLTNCELVNLKDMFENGTVINKKMIETPKSLKTAVTVATQIAAQVASSTYGGQTMTLSHLAPYVRVSKNKYIEEIRKDNIEFNLNLSEDVIEKIATKRTKSEIKDAVQTFNYQLSTLNSTNGQSPFLSLAMYISEEPEYEEETAMLIEEILIQRIKGMKNEYGVYATQTFPKLLYFTDENNIHEDSKYYYLTQLAAKSTAKRMNPDYISVKKMKDFHGEAFPCMGCRSFLSPWVNEDGLLQFYGRGNLGVTTLNLVDIAIRSEKDMNKFWTIFDNRLDLVKESLMLRYDKLKGVKASVAPIMWMYGAISRLNADDEILTVIDKGRFTLSLGYAGVFETVQYMLGKTHTSDEGFKLADAIMKKLDDTAKRWKEETGLGFGTYGSPQESTGGWFADKMRSRYGDIPGVTDKGWITNSYHVDIQEEIDAFDKLEFESHFQKYSLGGNISYIETPNMDKNTEALLEVIKFMYNTNIYAEFNSKSDTCGVCKFQGEMLSDKDTLEWVCPQCGNRDQAKLSVVRRTCGYLGETTWTIGRLLDILNRVLHL